MEDLYKILDFCVLLDNMKSILRKTKIISTQEFEDDAQHSFHISAMAILLKDYGPQNLDLEKVLKMLLFHDVVEIYAGDTFCYDEKAVLVQKEKEEKAALEIYELLPENIGKELFSLWKEFEKGESSEASFAMAMDRTQPILNNFYGGGGSWIKYNVNKQQILDDKVRIIV